MSYRKHVQGDHNQANETGAFNHNSNRFVFHGEGSRAITIFVCYIVVLTTAGIVFMCLKFATIVIVSVVGGFGLGIAALLVLLVSTVVRHTSSTHAHFWMDRANAEWSRHVYSVGPHTVVRNPYTNEITVHNAAYITENRQYPVTPQIEAPKEPDVTEVVLTMWDKGSSARNIEKNLNYGKYKDEKISYYQIQKILGLYRQGWENKHKKGDVSEPYDVDE